MCNHFRAKRGKRDCAPAGQAASAEPLAKPTGVSEINHFTDVPAESKKDYFLTLARISGCFDSFAVSARSNSAWRLSQAALVLS